MGKGLAIASLVLGIIGLLSAGLCGVGSLVGIALAIAALVRAKAPGGEGRELAWAGLVMNVLAMLTILPVVALLGFLQSSGMSWDDPLPEPVGSWHVEPGSVAPPPPPPPPPPLARRGRPIADDAELGAPPPAPPPPGPVRVGGAIREPKKLKDVRPVYPDIARMARVQGIVILEATISPQGHVSEVRVLRGIPLLDEAAISAVKQWVYTPTLLNGVPVPVIMTVTVNFTLR